MTARTEMAAVINELRAEVNRLRPLADRYIWLRDRPRKSEYDRPYDAPFVINRCASRLYAIEAYVGESLDNAVDEDRLNDMCNFISHNKLVEGDARFADPDFRFSDEFAFECEDEARELLGFPSR